MISTWCKAVSPSSLQTSGLTPAFSRLRTANRPQEMKSSENHTCNNVHEYLYSAFITVSQGQYDWLVYFYFLMFNSLNLILKTTGRKCGCKVSESQILDALKPACRLKDLRYLQKNVGTE